MSWFESDDEFWEAFRRLQALSGEWSRWHTPEARKKHVDEFGVQIKPREVYFRKRVGASVSCVAKLSRSSMETLLAVTVKTSPQMSYIADDLIEQANERLLRLVGRRKGDRINLDVGSGKK